MTSWQEYSKGNNGGPNWKLILPAALLIGIVVASLLFLVRQGGEDTQDPDVAGLGSVFSTTTTPQQAETQRLNEQLRGEGDTNVSQSAALTVEQLSLLYPQSKSQLSPQRFDQARTAAARLATAYATGAGRQQFPGYFSAGEPNWASEFTIDFVTASNVPDSASLVRAVVVWHGKSHLGVGIEQMTQSFYFSVATNGSLQAVPRDELPLSIRQRDIALDGEWVRPGTTRRQG